MTTPCGHDGPKFKRRYAGTDDEVRVCALCDVVLPPSAFEVLDSRPFFAPGGGDADMEAVERIARLARMLGPDELAVLETLAQRLVAGRTVYGEFIAAGEKRELTRDAVEEVLDCAVYLSMQLQALAVK